MSLEENEEEDENSKEERKKIKDLGLESLSAEGFSRLMEHRKPKNHDKEDEKKPFLL